MSWAQICRNEKFRGLWVAMNHCRFDLQTRQPTEGRVVDADANLGDLCGRLREMGRSACSVLFCTE